MLFDSHAHCDDNRIQNEYPGGTYAYIESQFRNGISKMVNVGTNLDNSKVSIELANKFDNLYAACGIHPSDSRFYDDIDKTLEELLPLLKNEKVVAIGEIGLDYHYEDTDKEKQLMYFDRQMKIAKEIDKPVVIHNRDAHGDVLDMIKKHHDVYGIIHRSSGSAEMAKELLKYGYYISFSGTLTYKNAQKVKESCKVVPLDKVLIETDSPYLPPVPHRGEMNEPRFVEFTCRALAEIHNISYEEACSITYHNALKAFNL